MYGRGVDALGDGPMYGPSMSSGQVYTDKATITAVQKKLASIGYFNGVVDGKFGPVTEAALFNFSGQHGPPDGAVITKLFDGRNGPADWALLKRLGLVAPAAPMTFEPMVITLPKPGAVPISDAAKAMLAAAEKQADQASTPAQVQAAAAQVATVATNVPPEVKAQVAAAQQAAATATTPAQVEAAKEQVQSAIDKVEMATSPHFWKREAFAGIPVWKVAAGAGGTLALFGLAFLAFRPRVFSSKG
jgi:peptidoglycan hydrolase-like protein with peptidoglycan-binding domain